MERIFERIFPITTLSIASWRQRGTVIPKVNCCHVKKQSVYKLKQIRRNVPFADMVIAVGAACLFHRGTLKRLLVRLIGSDFDNRSPLFATTNY